MGGSHSRDPGMRRRSTPFHARELARGMKQGSLAGVGAVQESSCVPALAGLGAGAGMKYGEELRNDAELNLITAAAAEACGCSAAAIRRG